MSIFERISKSSPKYETPRPHTLEEREAESRRRGEEIQNKIQHDNKQKMEVAKERLLSEKPQLELRLVQIPGVIKVLERELAEMTGREMRRILDKEYKLNSAQSPIDSTDPRRQREYEEWVRAVGESKRATARMKQNLEVRVQKKQARVDELKAEKETIEQRIQRGY